jgi:hypothetical protein
MHRWRGSGSTEARRASLIRELVNHVEYAVGLLELSQMPGLDERGASGLHIGRWFRCRCNL